jgi:uncharacterized protein YegJ (DUF2314 family)
MLKTSTPLHLFSFILIFISFSCSLDNDGSADSATNETENEIRYLDPDDESVQRAYTEAQQNLPQLEHYFNKNDHNQYLIYLKIKFEENGEVEHMWGVLLDILDDNYKIRLDNEPLSLNYVQYGDTLTVGKDEVEDFLVYEGEEVLLGDFMNWIIEGE